MGRGVVRQPWFGLWRTTMANYCVLLSMCSPRWGRGLQTIIHLLLITAPPIAAPGIGPVRGNTYAKIRTKPPILLELESS